MKKILITGSTGFVGGAITRRWARRGLTTKEEIAVRSLIRNPHSNRAQALAELGLEIITGDLANSEVIPRAVAGCDLVVHCASGMVLKDPNRSLELSVRSTGDLYRAASNAGVKKFIFISTMLVYKDIADEEDESIQLKPWGDLYADIKIATEQELVRLAQSVGCPELIILRFPIIYGPGSFNWTVKPLERARRNRLFMAGSGQAPLRYLYVENMVDAVEAAAGSSNHGIYNVFDGCVSTLEFMKYYYDMVDVRPRFIPAYLYRLMAVLAELYSKITGKYVSLNRFLARRRLKTVSVNQLSAVKAIRELGWTPKISLQEGMSLIKAEMKL